MFSTFNENYKEVCVISTKSIFELSTLFSDFSGKFVIFIFVIKSYLLNYSEWFVFVVLNNKL